MKFIKITQTAYVAALSLTAFHAAAQDFPEKPIEIVVPYRPGGTPDLLTRIIAEKLTAQYGKAIVVQNKPGASGAIAAQQVMNAPADGYTLLVADNGVLAINPSLNTSLRYDPVKDFMPVTQIADQPFFIFARKDLGVTSLKELIDKARENAGRINYASVGTGSPHHLCMSMFAQRADIKLMHVPFKSIAEASSSMIAGDVQLVCTSPVGVKPVMERGAGVTLAITAGQRSKLAPEIPTFAESSGLKPLVVGATIGVLAKTGTPAGLVKKLSHDIQDVLNEPTVRAKIESLDMLIVADGPEAYAKTIQEELKRYSEMVKLAGLKEN